MCPEQGVGVPLVGWAEKLQEDRLQRAQVVTRAEGGGQNGAGTPCPSSQGSSGEAAGGIGARCSHPRGKGRAESTRTVLSLPTQGTPVTASPGEGLQGAGCELPP